VTARSSHIVKVRAAELGIEIVRQGSEQKRTITDQIAAELGLPPQKVCYIGDDLPDLAAMQHVGLAVAVADACAEVREAAHYVTTSSGGRGAVRETIELILKVQRRWEDIVQKYRHPSAEGVTG
jgi:YrbI family 3-deoxy-D-manno-octulosonate 8-phosphate phosphatase